MGHRAVVVSVVAVAVLAAGAVVGDRVALGVTERRVAEAIADGVEDVSGEPDVDIAGFPFLTQLAAGSFDDLTVTADGATLDGVPLEEVQVRAGDVSTAEPYTAGTAELTGTLTTANLTELVAEYTGLGVVELAVEEGLVIATTSVLGVDVVAGLLPRAAGRAIEADLERLDVAGSRVEVGELPQRLIDRLDALSIPVDGLPEGVELTDVTVTADGVRLVAVGTDVTVPQG
ncbi:DUF2993 domain-containing protein [uncultured Cellulomonas sp.]|uniref:LmeA family phospholipid-binding protein n=1 Tax=uncultured Cellulomonas sp. TaxID=189682 RepID=UPI00261DEE12|nr:DUF2993 domain-containing protein [uncultured Cellulomonas sp.]